MLKLLTLERFLIDRMTSCDRKALKDNRAGAAGAACKNLQEPAALTVIAQNRYIHNALLYIRNIKSIRNALECGRW
ncbi:hypothetical protein [Methylocapsa palsarum]|uniref:hypothetical protein n=1 Tax=Methylocapsa palsarum TaxID=1612308 RepID=UPI000B89E810|nr:hypothetical protein [Methylocapsa palsarum]